MKTVHRYVIEISDIPTSIAMPAKATLLYVALGDEPSFSSIDLWAEVETEEPKANRSFVVKGTGHPIGSARMHYVGTAVSLPDPPYSRLVWHVYEVV